MKGRRARRPPITQRPPWPAFSRRAGENAAAKIKEPSERGTRHGSTLQEQSFDPLEPEAGITCALIELDPRHCFVFFYIFFAGGGSWSLDRAVLKQD